MSRRLALALVLSSFAVTAAILSAVAAGRSATAPTTATSPAAFNEIVQGRPAARQPAVEVIVVLSAPPSADAAPGDADAAAEGRRVADGVIIAARNAGIPLRVHQTFHNALNGFSAFVPRTDVGRLPSIAGVDRRLPGAPRLPGRRRRGSLAALGASAQPQAPALSATGKGVSVALLDGPLDTSHPYLAAPR